MKKGKIHFKTDHWVACNSLLSERTSDPREVTCLTCRKSRAWREAWKR
jgi:hypothetical protein